MRYLCPICRCPCEYVTGSLRVDPRSMPCVECYAAFIVEGVEPPFPWKRRAQGIARRATMIAQSANARRSPFQTSFIGAMQAPLSRGMTSLIEGKASYTDAVRTMMNDLRAQLLPTVMMDFAQRLQDAANGVIREQWSNSSRST